MGRGLIYGSPSDFHLPVCFFLVLRRCCEPRWPEAKSSRRAFLRAFPASDSRLDPLPDSQLPMLFILRDFLTFEASRELFSDIKFSQNRIFWYTNLHTVMDSNEQPDSRSFICDEETLWLFDSFIQEHAASIGQTVDNFMNGIIEDQVFYGNFPTGSNGVQLPQEQPAVQTGAHQSSFRPTANERQYNFQRSQDGLDGRYQLSESSLYDSYTELHSLELIDQPVEAKNERGPATSTVVRDYHESSLRNRC